MKFAVQHGVADPAWSPAILAPDSVTGFARAVEEAGFAALGFSDHPAPSMRWIESGGEGSADPLTSLAFCAAVTTRIRLFPWALILPYRPPLLTAHQIGTLDALSGGRLTLAVGTGYLRGEFGALGTDFDARLEAFDETIALLRQAWAASPLVYQGPALRTSGTKIQPPVVQRPHPPLWVHGNSAWGRERAVRYGQGVIALMTAGPLAATIRTAPVPDLDAVTRLFDDVDARLAAAGRERGEVERIVSGSWGMLDARRGWDPAALLAHVDGLARLGADWMVVTVPGDDPAASEETVRRFGEEIIAQLPAPAHP